MNAADLYAGLVRTLREIVDLVPSARADWDSDRLLRLAVMKLWIDAGNYAEGYRREIGVPVRTDPWSALVGYRGMLAHQLPEDLSEDRLWLDMSGASDVLDGVLAAR